MKNKKKSVFFVIDCDDVLAKCNAYALSLLGKEKRKIFSIRDINRWGILGNELDERMKFFYDPKFVESQPLYEGCTKFLKELQGYGAVIVSTSVPDCCVVAREKFIQQHWPFLDGYYIGNDKVTAIPKKKDSVVYMLDDNISHLCACKDSNVIPVVMSRPWNVTWHKFRRVSTFEEFLNIVKVKELDDGNGKGF